MSELLGRHSGGGDSQRRGPAGSSQAPRGSMVAQASDDTEQSDTSETGSQLSSNTGGGWNEDPQVREKVRYLHTGV